MRLFLLSIFILGSLGSLINPLKTGVYPQEYFRSPLDSPLYISGSFGAIRYNHFHYGIDIRTYGQEGLPVYAVADGEVVRMKVSAYGYGKALYIDHPNGYTSVYAHLKSFSDTLQAYIISQQYKNESFEIDHFPRKYTLPVKKGDLIGYTGNSGMSSGPHLHFEIRDTRSEEIINPLLFGIPVQDTLAPKIGKLWLHRYNAALKHQTGAKESFPLLYQKWGDSLLVEPGTYALAGQIEDYYNQPDWGLGINYLDVNFEDTLRYRYTAERYAFDQSRYANYQIDFHHWWIEGEKIFKCYRDWGQQIPFFQQSPDWGWFNLNDSNWHSLELVVYDLAGHQSSKKIWLKASLPAKGPTLPRLLPAGTQTKLIAASAGGSVQLSGMNLVIPRNHLYDTVNLSYRQTPALKWSHSPLYEIGNQSIPIHKGLSLSIKPRAGVTQVSKLCLTRLEDNGRRTYAGGTLQNGWISGNIFLFGTYTLSHDLKAPVISPLSINSQGELRDSLLVFRIKDDFSGIASYRATWDGAWLMMDYDAKNNWLVAMPKEKFSPGKHMLTLVVTDNRKNSSVYKKQIIVP